MVYLLVRQSNFFLLLTKLQHSSLFYISRRGKRSKVTFPTTRIEKLSSSMTIPTNKFFIWKDNSIAEEKDKLLQIIFEIDLSSSKRRIFIKRPYLDSFLSTKNRLRIKLEGYANKMNPSTNYNAEINLLNVNQQIIQTHHDDDYVTNLEAFYNVDSHFIKIGDTIFSIIRDSAWLETIRIAIQPIIDCPVFPSCDWRNVTTKTVTGFYWFISANKKSAIEIEQDSDGSFLGLKNWEQVAMTPFFIPQAEHEGKFLAVAICYCDGENNSCNAAQFEKPIIRIDEPLIFETRQRQHCIERLDRNSYRIVSYNILADLYLNLKLEQKDLFFPYCPKEFQRHEYRYPLILREILGYNADLFFLQEVDVRMKKRFLLPLFSHIGFTPLFCCKANAVNEGVMIAFSSKFKLVSNEYNVRVSDLLQKELYPENNDIINYLSQSDDTCEDISLTPTKSSSNQILRSRPTVLQVALLQAESGINILAANTHLYFDPNYEEVKILQTVLCLRYIQSVIERINLPLIVLFAGDFNCSPDSQAIQHVLGKSITLVDKNNENNSLVLKNPALYESITGFPQYTNYTAGSKDDKSNEAFIGTLDYIWLRKSGESNNVILTTHTVPLPDHELVEKYSALPSKISPSDHIALIACLNFESVKEAQ